ncbi:tetratricopeptide repeat protein [Bradyrhizobium diazoefficiens]|uniref:O-linked N-acetylglucosamine transferase, SPINDLY family protein n=1 Tax=Bradyrhizobium diazoefficiens TaxID=1355477 RepID=UPI00190DBDC9|nr:tetratricopeptide repeat protein [Bradyrhizobium diazoefficiens]QQO14256.1 tetratricopeptide repeat protein [Bradyrhizobium diazoefficiens]
MTGTSASLQAKFRQGLSLHRHGDLEGAERIYRDVLESQPAHFDSLHMLGLAALQRARTEAGIALIQRAIGINDRVPAAHNNLGKGFLDLQRPEAALPCFDRALALDAGHREIHLNRAKAQLALGRSDEALASYQDALALQPDAEIHRNCGNILYRQKRYREALAAYDSAWRLKPDLLGIEGHRLDTRLHLADWNDLDQDAASLVASVRAGKPSTQPFIFLAAPGQAADQQQCARLWAERLHPPAATPLSRGERYAHERIRIAYLSADFRVHPMAFLFAGLIEHHDRSHFDIIGISFGTDDGSEIRARIETAFETFVDARAMSEREIAALIRAREIDIAVDLMGYTTNSRTGIFAQRPAPVQAQYLGFPGTMGAPYIDYVIADGVVVPADERGFYSEKVVTLPDCYFVNDDRRAVASRIFSRAELGLPPEDFVFCCFNSTHKITPALFDRWMQLLAVVDGSVLWLLRDNADAVDNLRREASHRGIDPARLVFADRLPAPEHLARHRAADLFLDTLPYNAHTTAADALWAGLPVLTCLGATFAGRVAASMLRAVGLPELIAPSLDDYERLAIALAVDRERLAEIRARLARNRLTKPLFDTALFTRRMEAAFAAMHARHQAGLPPDHIEIHRAG